MDEFFPGFDDSDDEEESGYFDDDGNRLNPDLIDKPGLCLLCLHDDNPQKLVECNLTRLGQVDDEGDFICEAFQPRESSL